MNIDSNTPADTKPIVASNEAIEQYKAKLSDLGNLGSRHTAMTTYYISIVSALFGVLAFKEKSLYNIDTIVLLMICSAGFLICLLWFFSLTYFRSLFRAKLTVLQHIEQSLPFQTFQQEYELLLNSHLNSWLWIERLVPVVFGLFFIVVACVRAAQT